MHTFISKAEATWFRTHLQTFWNTINEAVYVSKPQWNFIQFRDVLSNSVERCLRCLYHPILFQSEHPLSIICLSSCDVTIVKPAEWQAPSNLIQYSRLHHSSLRGMLHMLSDYTVTTSQMDCFGNSLCIQDFAFARRCKLKTGEFKMTLFINN